MSCFFKALSLTHTPQEGSPEIYVYDLRSSHGTVVTLGSVVIWYQCWYLCWVPNLNGENTKPGPNISKRIQKNPKESKRIQKNPKDTTKL